MRFPELNHRKKGFTLTELLIVVAIIGILLAIAVPSVLAYYKELKVTELDDSARTIFVAAQNRLTALINAGEDLSGVGAKIVYPTGTTGKPDLNYIQNNSASITSLHNILPAGSVDTQLQDNNFVIEFNPQSGAVYAVWYWEKYDFHYNSIDPDANPTEKNDRVKNGKMVGYYGGENIDRLTAGQMPFPSVKLINAEELRVEITVPNSTTVTLTDNNIRVDVSVNGELILKDANIWQEKTGTVVLDTLKLPGAGKDSPYPLEDIAGKGNSGWIYGNKFKNLKAYDPASPSATEPTESLKTVPGDDITVSVKLYYNGTLANGTTPLPQTVTVTTNSLFERVTEESGGTKIAHIAYGRHLQNLHDSANYSVTGGVFCSGVVLNEKITKALQTKNIDFSVKNTSGDPAKDVYYWGSMYNDAPASYTSANEFHPIANKNLTEFDGGSYEIRNMVAGSEGRGGLFSYVAYGNSLVLKRITLVNPQIHSGTSSSAAAGGLVAMAEGTIKIDECAVYSDCDFTSLELDDLVTSGSAPNHVEKLKGYPHIGAPEEGSSLGGFVGLATGNVTILNSHVSMILVGAGFTGGLIGNNSGTAIIQNSYSADFIYSNRKTGGLVGFISSGGPVEISNCYATGVVKKGYSAFVCAGLAYSDDPSITITATNSYVAIKYIGEDINGRPAQESDGSLTGTIYGTYRNDNSGSNYYVPQSGITYGCELDGTGAERTVGCGESKTTAQLIAMVGTGNFAGTEWYVPVEVGGKRLNPAGVTNPYRLIKELKNDSSLTIPYPYPMLKSKDGDPVPHYGDWLENKANGSLVNWEQYGVSQYGFWGLMGSGGGVEPINTLKRGDPNDDDLDYAIADGYGVLVPQDASGNSTAPDVTIETSTGETKVDFSTAPSLLEKGVYEDGGVKYDLYKIPYTAPTSYYTAVTVNGSTFWYNPDFACEVLAREDGVGAPTEPQEKKDAEGDPTGVAPSTTNGVVIRTARQLANLVTYTNDTGATGTAAKGWSYTQLLDINFAEWGSAVNGKAEATGLGASQLSSGSYNGKNFKIVNLYLGTSTSGTRSFSSLFLTVTNDPDATTPALQYITLVNVKTSNSYYAAGLVANLTNATVSNCGIYVDASIADPSVAADIDAAYKDTFFVQGTGTGGLVAQVSGTSALEGCYAAVKVKGGLIAGGLVGLIESGANVTFTNCYAGGHTEKGAYDSTAPNVSVENAYSLGSVGGFIGTIAGGVTFSGVNYSTCSVGGGNYTGLFIGQVDGVTVTAPTDGAIYATGVAFNVGGTGTVTDESSYHLATGNAIPRGTLDDAHTYNYDSTLNNVAYPYETNLSEHHGDWVTFPMLSNIEKYQNGTTVEYGAYAASVDASGKVNVAFNNLKSQEALTDAGMDLVNDYYRIISPQELTTLAFTLDGTVLGTLELDKTNFNSDGTVKLGTETYYVYNFFVGAATSKAPEVTNYYHTLENGNYTFLFNSRFGLEAFDVTAKPDTAIGTILEKPEAAGKKGNDVVEVEYKDETGTTTDNPTGVVIRSARQLANMQEYTNHTESTISDAAQGWVYDQLLDVNFEKYTGSVAGGKTVNSRLDPATLTTGAYDGHGHLIVNLNIGPGAATINAAGEAEYAPAGLFGTVGTGGEVRHVRMVNIDLDLSGNPGEDSDAIGGLIGRLNGGTVDDCGIYVDLDQQTAIRDLANLYTSKIVRGSGESGVGGLIGQVQSTSTVTNSFAAVKVEGTATASTTVAVNPVGGFVGQINGGTFENCYVGGYVDATSKTYKDGSVNVKGNNNVGGFVGDIAVGSAKFNGINYSTASVYGPDAANLGLFAGATATGWKNGNGTSGWQLYALAKAFTDDSTGQVVTAARNESAYLSNPEIQDPAKADAKDTKYNAVADKYPYQTNLSIHHGDWIGLTQGAYYDTTQASGAAVAQPTGWYSQGGALVEDGFNTLTTSTSGSGLVAIDDGYAFLSTVDLGDLAVSVDGVSYPMEREKDASGKAVTTRIDGKDYFVYYVPAAALNTPTKHYYATVSVNGQLFTANLGLAAEIFNEKTEEAKLDEVKAKTGLKYGSKKLTDDPGDPSSTDYTGAAIRSARQLANLGIRSNMGTYGDDNHITYTDGAKTLQKTKYAQLLDIDMTRYTAKYKDAAGTELSKIPVPHVLPGSNNKANHTPITLTDGGYYGHNYTIRNLIPGMIRQATEYDSSNKITEVLVESGLFGCVTKGTLEDITLINATVDNDASKATSNTSSSSSSSTSSKWDPAGDKTHSIYDNNWAPSYTATNNGLDMAGKTATYADNGMTFTVKWATGKFYSMDSQVEVEDFRTKRRVYLGGRINDTGNYVSFSTIYDATVTIWWGGNQGRQVGVSTATGTSSWVTDGLSDELPKNGTKTKFTCEVTSGTYYIGSKNSGIDIYKVEVIEHTKLLSTPGGPTNPTPIDPADDGFPVAAVTGDAYLAHFGALVGVSNPSAGTVTISNCGVYVDAGVTLSTSATDDEKKGAAEKNDEAYNTYVVRNSGSAKLEDAVGGLIGAVRGGTTISSSFAAVKVTGVSIAGGFAGQLGGTATVITDCYVGGHTVDGTFGNKDNTNIMVNISTTDTTKRTFTGGFVGKMSDATFNGINYTTASVGMAYNKYQSGTNNDVISTIGQFAGDGKPGSNNGNLYSIGSIFRKDSSNSKYDYFPLGTKAGFKDSKDNDLYPVRDEDYLNNGIVAADITPTAHSEAYDDVYETAVTYPYASGQAVHHGDWTDRYGFIYYEVYDSEATGTHLADIPGVGDRVGFYAVLKDTSASGKRIVNTLSTTGHVIDSGYMILTDREVGTIAFSIFSEYGGKQTSGKETYLKVSYDNSTTGVIKDENGKIANYFYVIPFDKINNAPSEEYYEKVTINGQPYMLNPYFACEAVNVGLTKEVDGQYVMDYSTVREKPELQVEVITRNNMGGEDKETKGLEDVIPSAADTAPVLIRSPWNLASMARYTREGNTASRVLPVARTWNFIQMLDIDYKTYTKGRIFDGNPSNKDKDGKSLAGTDDNVGQVAAMLGGEISNTKPDGTIEKIKKAGSYDGLGHTIKNLYLASDTDDSKYIGLFGLVTNGSTVKDVKLQDIHVNAWGGNSGGCYVGTIAAQIDNGTVENVTAKNVAMDFHKVVYYNKGYKESGAVKLNAVGGAVGQMKNGTVKNVLVDDLSINFNSGKAEFSYKLASDKSSYSRGTGANDYTSSVKDDGEIFIGGAIGEIDVASGADVSVTDVYVVNPLIKANKGTDNSVGGVVGKAVGNAEIANSGVYHVKTTDSSGAEVTAAKMYEDGGVLATAGTTTDHTDHVGGFAGEVGSGVTVTNSFAAVKVTGKLDVGGFAGRIADATIENCFAGGHTASGQYATGTGNANVTATDTGTAYAGGFAGSVDNTGGKLTFKGTVYSTASVEGANRGAFLGNEAGTDAMKAAKGGATLYATGISADTSVELWDEATEYGLRTGLDVPTGSANATNHYDIALDGKTYPFKNETKVNLDGDPDTSAVAAHFGDWAKAEMVSAIYYELEGGTYHFYSLRGEIATGKFGTKPIDSLCKKHDGKAITAWGYGYLVPDGVTVTDKSGAEIGTTPTGDLQAALEGEFGAGVKIVAGSTAAKLEPDTWTFTDTSGKSISFYVNTAYAAAIEAAEKDSSGDFVATTLGTEENPYQIRTVQQLDNMDGTDTANLNTNYFEETHDISGKGEPYSGIDNFGGHFNGQSYRILDLTITTGGLFNEVYGDVVLENIVLYAPANDGSITASGNAGGLVAATRGTSLTIRNCAVAGYTITATSGNAGGLVGSHEAGTLTIENSEATTTLSGASVGGLVGFVGSGGTLKIINSYAGGSIAKASSAGGVIGSQNTGSTAKITYKNVYAYVDMTKVNKNNQKYGIGPQVNILSKDNVGFWGGGVENVNTDDHDLRKALLSLVDWSDDPSKETASEQTYIPETTNGLTNRQSLDATSPYYDVFPYEAYVTDWQGENVHYGDWPRPSDYAAAFYWEKEKVEKSDGTTTEEYHFYAYGAEYMEDGSILGSELIDTLCYSHHINERAGIVDYGYGYFYPTTDRSGKTTGEFDMKVSSAPTGVTRNFVDISADLEEMQTAMFEAFGLSDRAGDYKVQVLVEVGTAYKRDENWTLTNSNTTSGFYQAFGKNGLAMKVNPAFGAGIYNSNFEYGKSEDKDLDVTTPAQVRTAQQFRNVMLNSNVNNLDYVALTHDIDFADESYTPGVLQPQLVNGNGYRILDVKIQTAGDASLFTTNKGNVVIKNLVIYSPDNTGLIESTLDKNAAGFFAAQPDYNVIIENCVIAGYTIKGGGYIGGFIGQTRSNSGNRIADSQAYVTLDCNNKATAAGGLVGQIRASGTINNRKDDTTKTSDAGIFDCYTGGKVINATSNTTVGGIFGVVNNSVTVKNSYTYMDLKDTSLGSAKVYPIGSDTNATITNCSYYEECFTGTTTQATKAQISDLAVKAGENAAEYSWWPEDPATATAGYYGWIGNQMGRFPFRAVASYTEDGVKHYVHYGQWPFDAQVMGIAYWELYSDGEVGLQIVGVDKDGNKLEDTDGKIIDTLRKDPPDSNIPTSNEIVSTGYVSFSTIYNMSISMDGSAGTKLTDTNTVAKIAQALDVKLTGVCTHMSAFITPEGTGAGTAESATVTVNGKNVSLYYSSGFAGVSYDATFGQEATPFEIRTVEQLDNIPESSAACFKQTHDLYGETYTSNGTATGDPKYTGAVKFAGTYDGQSYRVLDLEMSGANKNVGLFAEIGTGAKLKNIILYSPNGATISGTGTTGTGATNDHYGVGGLVGSISSDSSTNKATIENCVVAGYTIEGEQYVGGIVGWGFYGVKITNCAAVNEITCEAGSTNCGVGGILGGYGSNSAEQTEITNCYSGGKITVSGDNASSAVVGGIAGTDGNTSNHALVKNCYTYIDMSGCTTSANVYAISASYNESSSNNYYLNTCVPTSLPVDTNAKGGKAMSNTELAGIFKETSGEYIDGFGEANYTYVPGAGDTGWKPSTTAYPFPAVVTVDETDPGGATTKKYVHYGDPPTT